MSEQFGMDREAPLFHLSGLDELVSVYFPEHQREISELPESEAQLYVYGLLDAQHENPEEVLTEFGVIEREGHL